MSKHFPTFERFWPTSWQLWPASWQFARWLSTPWWPADRLASKQEALLRVILAAVAERLELAPLVAALAAEHRGRYRRRLFRLAKRLAAGTSLPDALEQTPGALTDDQALAIRFGIESGTLAESLKMLINQHSRSGWEAGQRLRQSGYYLVLVGLIFFLVLSFLMIKIIPSFHAIMDDFSLEPPLPFWLLIGFNNAVAQLALPIFLLVLLGRMAGQL